MRVTDTVYRVIKSMEGIGVVALLFTMVITSSDVVMGMFKRPIGSAYDLAGIGSGIAVSFALAIASWNKQHIMVDTFTQKLPVRLKVFWEFTLRIINLISFAFISFYLFKLAVGLKGTGEVVNTLPILPLWPIAFLLGCACLAQCLVSIANMLKILREGEKHD
jgi:TRAP-type C4-dicarboxylate transport system permease small subunit